MKVCILSIVNIKHMSLISLYTTLLDKNSIEYDIIYIDKYNELEKINANKVYRYPIKIKRQWSKLKKLSVYWGFKKYAQEIIEANKYDFVIVWRSETALMFANYLYKKMKGRYCINIRDYCMEKNFMVFSRLKKVISGSKFTTISSEGFKIFLPKHEYVTVHSYNEKILNTFESKEKIKENHKPLHICFIGYVRFFENDKKLIDALGNDERYIIQFFGEGSQYLKEYAKEKNITNTEFVGGFPVEKTVDLLSKADVINNLYGFDDIALDTAISTRYYYALHLQIPILVFKGTYMEEISLNSGIGYAVTEDFTDLADNFYEWYQAIDNKGLEKNCHTEIKRIKKDNEQFNKLIENTFLR